MNKHYHGGKWKWNNSLAAKLVYEFLRDKNP